MRTIEQGDDFHSEPFHVLKDDELASSGEYLTRLVAARPGLIYKVL